MRERRACFGELVQIDGSDYDWFEGRSQRCTLLVFVDDASGKLVELWFVAHESFFGYCEAARHYFERYGKPGAFYSDKHGIFHLNLPQIDPGRWPDRLWQSHAGVGYPDHLCQYPSGQRQGRTGQPDPAGPPDERIEAAGHLHP